MDNGCMWFIAGSHKEGLRYHRPVTEGHHVRMTDDVDPDLATPCPVQAGGCTVHTGKLVTFPCISLKDKLSILKLISF